MMVRILDEIRRQAAGKNARQDPPEYWDQGQRAFVTGAAVVQQTDKFYGIDPENWSPEHYGYYIAGSHSIYSVLNQRSELLASLPIRLYQIDSNTRRRFSRFKRRDYAQAIKQKLQRVAHSPQMWKRAVSMENLTEVTDGPVFELLHKVNPYWTTQRLIRMTDMSMGLWGRSFWFLERGTGGNLPPQEIWWAKSPWVRVVPDEVDYIKGYIFDPPTTGQNQTYDPSETIWFNLPNPNDEFQPLSPIAPSRIYADNENASMQSNTNLHRQGLQMGGVIWPTNNKVWNDEVAKEIENDLNRRFAGTDNAHKWGVFKHSVELKEAGITPSDAEFLLGMNWDLEAVARVYNWPIDLIGGRRTYENQAAAMVAAYTFGVLPQGNFIATEMMEQLLPMFGDTNVDLIVFDASDVVVLQEAENERWSRESDQIQQGAITINEWRASKGLDPLPWGDEWWVAANTVPAGIAAAGALVEGLDEIDEMERFLSPQDYDELQKEAAKFLKVNGHNS